ncbi:MAG: hypothetical protein K2K81_10395 [Muribaculaceae bacterium]|nr:hypothetical protein [Muribaculaceae bacterium]
MDLKDYVKEVISQISEAVTEINGNVSDNYVTVQRAIVNPSFGEIQDFKGHLLCILSKTEYSSGNSKITSMCKITEVDFDVTLSASSKSDKGGKIDLKVLGGGITNGDESSTTNRVKFTLPVLFPSVLKEVSKYQ